MIIIVEGIDRVGKSTLCKMIEEQINIPIHKHVDKTKYNTMDNDNETDKMLNIVDVCNVTCSDIIFDRFHLSEYVYGCLDRDYDVSKALKNFREVDRFINQAILICVLPTDIERSSKEHGSDLSKHKEMFDMIFSESKIQHKFRCTYNTLSEAISFVRSIYSNN